MITAKEEIMRKSLERIAKWFGEFPEVTLRNGSPCSYGAAYGSNGERDFMRNLATKALEEADSHDHG